MKRLLIKGSSTLLLTFFAFLGGVVSGKVSVKADDKAYEEFQLFTYIFRLIETKYIEEVKTKDLIYGAIQGMVNSIDPYSSFMPPDVYKEMSMDTMGTFGGVGIELTIQDDQLTVLAPIEDTPAYNAGIKAGDKIIKINGESTEGYNLVDAVRKIRGPLKTTVTLTIMREGFDQPRDFTITRGVIKIKSVKGKSLSEGYGYIRITHFQANTGEEFNAMLNKLEKDNGQLKGLILDLRDNPGGLLDQAVSICDQFIDKGVIVYTKGRLKEQNIQHLAQQEGTHPYYPLVVLMNGGSASASEIVAGALQDHGRAVILGTRSFGKGTVQTIIPLSDGSGLRLTTAKYFTPQGRDIQATGIIPDIIVEQPQEIYIEKPGNYPGYEVQPSQLPSSKERESPNLDFVKNDTQLSRALDILKSWEIFKSNLSVER